MQLGLADGYNAEMIGTWPREGPFLQSAVVKLKAIGVPKEDFELIATAIKEDKPSFAEWIHVQLLGDNQRQTIDRLSHVGDTGDQKDLAGRCHCSASIQCLICAGPGAAGSSARMPLAKSRTTDSESEWRGSSNSMGCNVCTVSDERSRLDQ